MYIILYNMLFIHNITMLNQSHHDIQFIMLALDEFIWFRHRCHIVGIRKPSFYTFRTEKVFKAVYKHYCYPITLEKPDASIVTHCRLPLVTFPMNLYELKCVIRLGECMPQFHSSLTIVLLEKFWDRYAALFEIIASCDHVMYCMSQNLLQT